MKGGKQKICNIEDTEQLRSVLVEGGSKLSCEICCATSNDAESLCKPVESKGSNLFCDPRI
jgi:hypothetical protein